HLLPVRHGSPRRGRRQVGVRPGGGRRPGAATDGLLLRGRAMTAVVEAGVEAVFAEVLAEVLGTDAGTVDSHFFDDLGADSLVMAHSCARLRKRGGLPPVSMRDVYAHPTIRSLVAALADAAPRPTTPSRSTVVEAAMRTSTWEYVLCGALQALFFLAYSYG